jgi:aspartate aminotransferase
VPAGPETGFKITPAQLRQALTPRTRVFLLNSPSNPTGAVYSIEELRALAEVLRDSDAIVLSDEIYDAIVYGPYARWLRAAPDFAGRTLVVNGASKAYAMTGWRLGYIAGPAAIMEGIKGIQSHASTHTSSVTQAAALVAYDGSATTLGEEVTAMVAAFRQRRDTIVSLLRAIPGIEVALPDGAFYAFPDVRGLLNRELAGGQVCRTEEELAAYLLESAHIGVVPGSAFGAPGFIRLSYATSMAQIEEGMRRLRAAVA